MSKICYIIGAGDVSETTTIRATEDDFIICADGGFCHRKLLGRDCDLAIGDFDSLGAVPDFENHIVYPREKDHTDMRMAIDEGLKRGYKEFVIFGALGGDRFDHSLGNIAHLSYICGQGARGTFIHKRKTFIGFANGEVTIPAKESGVVSVFSLCDVSEGVTIENFKYTAKDIDLRYDTPIGVSNEFIGMEGKVSVKKGRILVAY